MFEHTELFTRTSGETSDVVTKEMYTFEDKGGRSLTLRPESTASVVRAYLTHAQELPNPFKAYYVGLGVPPRTSAGGAAARVPAVRHRGDRRRRARPPTSRSSCWASGSCGSAGSAATTSHLNSIGDENCRPAYREMLVAYFEPYPRPARRGLPDALSKNPLRVFDCKVDGRKDFVLAAPDDRRPPVRRVRGALRGGARGAGRGGGRRTSSIPGWCAGSTTTRGTAFEWVSSALTADQAATVNAGGRYDGLAEALGGPADAGRRVRDGAGSGAAGDGGGGGRDAAARTPRCFVVARSGRRTSRAGGASSPELRDAGDLGGREPRGPAAQGPAEDGRPRRGAVRRDPGGAGARRRHRDAAAGWSTGCRRAVPRWRSRRWLTRARWRGGPVT